VNVLLYAFRRDADRHAEYQAWLQDVVTGDEPYGMAPQALASVLRISTNPRIFAPATPLQAALDFCRVLLESDNCVVVQPGPPLEDFFRFVRRVRCHRQSRAGRVVAALAIEAGCEWITTDRDYALFRPVGTSPYSFLIPNS
jgi:toxin-antitoxin system PIN domain toxin